MDEKEIPTAEDFTAGKILLIDKPLEWTSFDAVKKVKSAIRRKFSLKKIKVGHAGTLDPLATGLLIICTGKKTKEIANLTGMPKIYTGRFRLGATTASYDLESETENNKPTGHITPEDVRKAAAEMTGIQDQFPPIFSAKQVGGKRAYIAARKGEHVELKTKRVEIADFEVDTDRLPDVGFTIKCSTGTYIRSMARDLGEKLGCGAHLVELRRISIGDYHVRGAITPQVFAEWLENAAEDI